jgi:hypothetical protein
MVRARGGDRCNSLRQSHRRCAGACGRGEGGSHRTGLGWSGLGRELGWRGGLGRGLYKPGVWSVRGETYQNLNVPGSDTYCEI